MRRRFRDLCVGRPASLLVAVSAWLGVFGGPAMAADRALLIGVGAYSDPAVTDLPGIDLDIGTMKRVVRRLGFEPAQTRVLADAEATLEAVERTFADWLVDGVGADDRVLVYYSGHGSQWPDDGNDEDDGLDEVLLLHDFSQDADEGPAGMLVDDRFQRLLAALPTDQVMLIVDACHSGSGHRSILGSLTGASDAVTKSHPGGQASGLASEAAGRVIGKGSDKRFIGRTGSAAPDRLAALMASGDNERAVATVRGSLFTLGIEQAVEQAAASTRAITPRQIMDGATRFIRKALHDSPDSLFTPQLAGDPALLDALMPLASNNPDREAIEALTAGLEALAISTGAPSYALGDLSLQVSVEVPAPGYLNVVTVDPDGAAVVLYPNAYEADNRVERGILTLPTQRMDFDLRADGPVGEHLITAVWTPQPLDLHRAGFGERDSEGLLLQPFAEFSEFGSRAFSVAKRESAEPARAGSAVVMMVP